MWIPPIFVLSGPSLCYTKSLDMKKLMGYLFPALSQGDVAQLVRACGSYPQCPGFKSLHRHQPIVRNYPALHINPLFHSECGFFYLPNFLLTVYKRQLHYWRCFSTHQHRQMWYSSTSRVSASILLTKKVSKVLG